jgi:hypothetical protein
MGTKIFTKQNSGVLQNSHFIRLDDGYSAPDYKATLSSNYFQREFLHRQFVAIRFFLFSFPKSSK